MSNQQIMIDTMIAAPVERVWDAYTTPADITRWNFASDDWCCPSAEADLKVGGAYKARMEAKDGSFGFDFEAVYDEVELNKAITLAMSDGRKACTTFESTDSGTKVTTVFDAESVSSYRTLSLTAQPACNQDYCMARELGVDLVRSQTIADGAEHCDFRWVFSTHGERSEEAPQP